METLLYGESILFAEGQFTNELVEILSERIIELGGTITSQREGSTILLANPSHPSYKQELDHITYLRRTYPDIPQPDIQPYHWIANIHHLRRLIPIEQLPIISPIFVYPTKLDNNRPIKVWVSVNVSREEGESPEQARDALLRKLECAGAIGVIKRAQADLLVVDESSAFAKKVYEERKRYGRDWQKVVERDWVDSCLRNRRLEWKIQDKEQEGGESDGESFGEDETALVRREGGKGPGRPPGGPRNEYTPQDDDFLCRYLAAHHPTGSWGSRKTYENLFAAAGQYPIAERHSGQSWHERFKKNHVQFEKRVRGYVLGGIDRKLRTKSEREKAKAKPTQNDPNINSAIPPTTQAGPSRPTVTSTVASSSRVQQGKMNLVDLDEESPSSTRESERQPRVQSSAQANLTPVTSITPTVHAPEKPQEPEVPPPVASTNTVQIQSGPSNPSALPQLKKTASTATDDESLLNDLIPDESQIPVRTFGSRNAGHQAPNLDTTSKDAHPTRNQERRTTALPLSHSGSVTDTNDEDESQKGEATQAILADFAKAQAAATQQQVDGNDKTSKSVRVDEGPATIVPLETNPAPNLDAEPLPPQPSSSTSTPQRRPPNVQSSQSSPVHIILSPPKRSANEPASQPGPSTSLADGRPSTSDSARMSIPFQLEVNIRAIPAEQAEPQIVDHQAQPESQNFIEAGPSTEILTRQRVSDLPDTPGTTVSGSSRHKRKSLLQEHLTSSATKRRRTQERIPRRSGSRKSHGLNYVDDEEEGDGPDMVLRETSIPPRPIRITPSIPPSPTVQPARAPSPPLSVQEKNERYLRGKELMDRNIQTYKDRVLALSRKFGMLPGQVIAFINERKGRGSSGERYWEEIERALRERK